jgi:hypothetical protein
MLKTNDPAEKHRTAQNHTLKTKDTAEKHGTAQTHTLKTKNQRYRGKGWDGTHPHAKNH